MAHISYPPRLIYFPPFLNTCAKIPEKQRLKKRREVIFHFMASLLIHKIIVYKKAKKKLSDRFI
jgi:hypothetical protein